MSKQHLIILGKYPKEGNVKTRLGEKIGHPKAVKFYKQCAEKIFSQIEKIQNQVTPYFYYGNKEDKEAIAKWVSQKFMLMEPQSNDIEEHLLNAFTDRFNDCAQKVVSIATDVPKLSVKIIEEAFKVLDEYDVVIGPDHKNGFYLFGIKKMYPLVFQYQYKNKNNMVNEEIGRLKILGLKYFILPVMMDIDTHEDLKSAY